MFARCVLPRLIALTFLLCSLYARPLAAQPDPLEILEKSVDYWRGASSSAVFTLTIHRPDFERSLIMEGWTKGREDGLFVVRQPAKDAGNATLKKGREMWTYNPKINRVIKLPPSMMSQSWMGSDFSNDDLAKSDSVLEDYTHKLLGQSVSGDLTLYTIEATAKEDAPVVWGKQVLQVREDGILLHQAFYDEDMILVKEMSADGIELFGDRLFPRRWEMRRTDKEDQYTRLEYRELHFDVEVKDAVFSRSYLQRGGRIR